MYGSPDYELFTLFHEGFVSNYYVTFTILANRVEEMSPSAFLSHFISVLKKGIQRDIIPWRPESITTAVALAKLYEEKYITNSKTVSKKQSYNPDMSSIINSDKKVIPLANPFRATIVIPIAGTSNAQQTFPSTRTQNSQYRKISFNEIQLRKAKGLCFNCDKKFTPSHRCANKRLLLLK